MATDSAVRSVTNTLSTTVADEVTLTQPWPAIAVTNHDTTNTAYFRQDGVVAVGAANNTSAVLPGQTVVAAASVNEDSEIVVSVVGSGGGYTIEGVN